MSSYVRFNYLYRDAGNYKSWAEIIFPNPDQLTLREIDKRLRLAFEQEILFIANQIEVTEVFLFLTHNLNEDDHCFHEYDSVEIIEHSNLSIEHRSIKQFIEQVENASKLGWQIFNPKNKIAEIRNRSSLSV